MAKKKLIEYLKVLEKQAREKGDHAIADDALRLQQSLARSEAEPPDIPVGN